MVSSPRSEAHLRADRFRATQRLLVIGVGGLGVAAINRMIEEGLEGVEFLAVDTDAEALYHSEAPYQIKIGNKLTNASGARGDPQVGAEAAKESEEQLRKAVADSDMVFVTTGIGGGTGTGASPLIARLAGETGALTIGVVTKPFTFEGTRRAGAAEQGIAELKGRVDTLIAIPYERVLEWVDKSITIQDADDVLRQAVQAISALITQPGPVNLDLSDLRSVLADRGLAAVGIGRATGKTRGVDAARVAVTSPLLDKPIDRATVVLLNVTGGTDLRLYEVNEAARVIRDTAHPGVNLIFGAVMEPEMEDGEIQVTVIATGFIGQPNGEADGISAYPSLPPPAPPPPPPYPGQRVGDVEVISVLKRRPAADQGNSPRDG